MELVFYIIVSWLVIAYLITSIKGEEVKGNIIIYAISIMLNTSIFSIISMNLELVLLTEDKIKFLSLILCRDIIAPLILLIFVNSFNRLTSYKKIFPVVLSILCFELLDFINVRLQFYTYLKWNFGLTFLINFIFTIITLFLSKLINTVQLRSEL